MKNEAEVGSVVTCDNYNGPFVITGMKSWEDRGNCCFERDYYMIPLSEIENMDYINENEGIKVEVKYVTILPFTIVDGEAPFNIIKEVRYKVERMKAKIVTIYE